MKADAIGDGGRLCRQLWEAVESRGPLVQVASVVVSSTYLRWSLVVAVPWSRYGVEVGTHEDLERLTLKLEQFTAAADLAASPKTASPEAADQDQGEETRSAAECGGQLSLF